MTKKKSYYVISNKSDDRKSIGFYFIQHFWRHPVKSVVRKWNTPLILSHFVRDNTRRCWKRKNVLYAVVDSLKASFYPKRGRSPVNISFNLGPKFDFSHSISGFKCQTFSYYIAIVASKICFQEKGLKNIHFFHWLSEFIQINAKEKYENFISNIFFPYPTFAFVNRKYNTLIYILLWTVPAPPLVSNSSFLGFAFITTTV